MGVRRLFVTRTVDGCNSKMREMVEIFKINWEVNSYEYSLMLTLMTVVKEAIVVASEVATVVLWIVCIAVCLVIVEGDITDTVRN